MFNKIKMPIIGGNKKQRQEADEHPETVHKDFLDDIDRIQVKHKKVLIPWIQTNVDHPTQPSQIIKSARFYIREATPEELDGIEKQLGLKRPDECPF